MRIVLGHLSGDCNDPDLACATVSGRLREKGHGHVEVCCASQAEATPWFRVGAADLGATTVEAAAQPRPVAEQSQLI